jgi:hypothetical protein
MRRFTPEQMLTAFHLEQLLYDFIAEMDERDYAAIGDFYTEDGEFQAGPNLIKGRAAIVGFYAVRNENVRKYQKDGARTGRHTFVNVRCVFGDDPARATLHFTNVNYAGEGKAPVPGLQGPSMIADCRMECRLDSDGEWRFSGFYPSSALVGEDDFMKKMLALSQAK